MRPYRHCDITSPHLLKSTSFTQNTPFSIPPFNPQQSLPSFIENPPLSHLINSNKSYNNPGLFSQNLLGNLFSQQTLPNLTELAQILAGLNFQQNLQNSIFRAQVNKLLELKCALLEKINIQDSLSASRSESPVQDFQAQQIPIPSLEINEAENDESVSRAKIKPKQGEDPKKGNTAKIRDIVNFFLENYGRINDACFLREEEKYKGNKDLLQVFKLLSAKYSSTIKTKEEMIKYTLRKAFKFIKGKLRKETNTKGVMKSLCNKYFHASPDEVYEGENEEEFLKSKLPFR